MDCYYWICLQLLLILLLMDCTQGKDAERTDSVEDKKCTAAGTFPYVGFLKEFYCNVDRFGILCENDKMCKEDERCTCIRACEENRCKKNEKPNCSGNGNQIQNSTTTSCKCNKQYSGVSCQKKCDNTCPKNSDCIFDNSGNMTCECRDGFIGEKCEKEDGKDWCVNFLCENNSSCTADSDAPIRYRCICDTHLDFEGTYCNETKCKKVCKHKNTSCAFDEKKKEYCACNLPGFTGANCETVIDKCSSDSNFCHGGNCTTVDGSAKCTCKAHYTGNRCEYKILYCNQTEKNNCTNNATCILDQSLKNGYKCSCNTGFTGEFCETSIFCTSHDYCQNNGTCSVDSQSCVCPDGFNGSRCEFKVSPCNGVNCGNGSCKPDGSGGVGYKCTCETGFTSNGTYCVLDNPCEGVSCNNGTCETRGDGPGFKCVCPINYTGTNCETLDKTPPFDCDKSCLNGKCTTNGCECDVGYTGAYCETKMCMHNCSGLTECEEKCNVPECNFGNFTCLLNVDAFKNCKLSTCELLFNNGICNEECNEPECAFDGGECRSNKTCEYEGYCKKVYNNSNCEDKCNNEECGYDNLACSIKEKKLVKGELIFVVGSTPEQFKSLENSFQRRLSILLNAHVVVVDKNALKPQQRKRFKRAAVNNGNRLEVKTTLDNRECTKDCFDKADDAVNYIAVMKSKDKLKLPVAVYAVRSEQPVKSNTSLPLNPMWIILLLVCPIFVAGMVYKGRRVVTKLWRVDSGTRTDHPGTRMEPLGHEESELRNLKENDSPPLHEAKRPKLDIISVNRHQSLNRYDSSVPFLNNQHHTQYNNLLHLAVANGEVNRVRDLLETTDVNARDYQGKTPLHKAVNRSNTLQSQQIFDMLVRNRALNPDLQDNMGNTCLMLACAQGCNREMEELISLGCKVTLSNKVGRTALHFAAQTNNHIAVNTLIKHGAKVDAPDNQMRTPLHLAAVEPSCDAAAVLLANYASRSCPDVDDRTPLDISRRNGDQRMMMLLSDIANSPPMVPSPIHYPSSQDSISPQPVYPDIRPKLHPMNVNRLEHPTVKPVRRKRKSTATPKEKKSTAPSSSRDQYCEQNLMIASMAPMSVSTSNHHQMNNKETYSMFSMANKFLEPDNILKEIPSSWDSSQCQQSQPPSFAQSMPTAMFMNTSPFDTPPSVTVGELSPFNIPNIMDPVTPLTPPLSWTTSPESDYSDVYNNC